MEEDCPEDMAAVVRVWLLLLTWMVMAVTMPIGDLGNSDLRWWDLDMGGACWLIDVEVLRWERELVWLMRSEEAAGGQEADYGNDNTATRDGDGRNRVRSLKRES